MKGTVQRLASVDLLRGLVMVIMALDHTRDYVHAAAMIYRPEDLAQTTPAIFFTRWITHSSSRSCASGSTSTSTTES